MTSPAQTTSTGQALPTDRAWGPWVFIPNPFTGAPYKAQRTRAGVEEGTSERLTIWLGDDPRDGEPHDHPWPFTTTIIPSPTRGGTGYLEEVWTFDAAGKPTVEVFWRGAGETFEVPAGRAHHVRNVVPGTMTHMVIGKLTAGPKDWGHWTPGADGTYKYSLAQASPEFLQLLKHFGHLPE
jgi:hypothetical protein